MRVWGRGGGARGPGAQGRLPGAGAHGAKSGELLPPGGALGASKEMRA